LEMAGDGAIQANDRSVSCSVDLQASSSTDEHPILADG
jgi:hypothetical protein